MSLTSVLKPSELARQEIVDAVSEPPESGSSSEEEAFSWGIGSRHNEWKMAVALSELKGRVLVGRQKTQLHLIPAWVPGYNAQPYNQLDYNMKWEH